MAGDVKRSERSPADAFLEALDGLSRLVLINAVYFKGLWKNQFKAEDTKTEPFHVDSNRKVDILSICRL